MNSIIFKDILIADIIECKACYQRFLSGMNVVTSPENHYGKSCLLKSLYHALGAEVRFDDVWKNETKVYAVRLLSGQVEYKITRYKNNYLVLRGGEVIGAPTKSSELAKVLSQIFQFSVYLPDKKSKLYHLAPPVFMYFPYYIDQDHGWNECFQSFDKMNQFSAPDVRKSMYFHIGAYSEAAVSCFQKKTDLMSANVEREQQRERVTLAIDIFQKEMKGLVPADDVIELQRKLEYSKLDIERIVCDIGDCRGKIQDLEIQSIRLERRLRRIRGHSRKKHIADDAETLNVCPSCGYISNEGIQSLVHVCYCEESKNNMISLLLEEKKNLEVSIQKYHQNYIDLIHELKSVEKQYVIDSQPYRAYLKYRGLEESLNEYVRIDKEITEEIDSALAELKGIDKLIKKSQNTKVLQKRYTDYTREMIAELGAWSDKYESQLSFPPKPIHAQGAQSIKIVLAQTLALLKMVDKNSTSTALFPLVLDSPRGKEMGPESSRAVLKMIDSCDDAHQIILATINYEEYEKELSPPSNIIVLSEKQSLLSAAIFDAHRDEINELYKLLSV